MKEMKQWIKKKLCDDGKSIQLGIVPKGYAIDNTKDLWELLKDNRQRYYEKFECELFNYEFY